MKPSASPGRPFDLSAAREGLDWSAHVFPADRVAIYGFNSCFLNDRHWTGAAISRESIANAAAHAAEFADGFLRIAVWHHGIHTDGYRPDYLNQADLGALIVAGFQVGFHGHQHKAGAQQLGWLTDRFVLVAPALSRQPEPPPRRARQAVLRRPGPPASGPRAGLRAHRRHRRLHASRRADPPSRQPWRTRAA